MKTWQDSERVTSVGIAETLIEEAIGRGKSYISSPWRLDSRQFGNGSYDALRELEEDNEVIDGYL